MKKLSLGKLELASEEELQRSELSVIYGGSGSGTGSLRFWCTETNENNQSISYHCYAPETESTCTATLRLGSGADRVCCIDQ